MTLVKFKNRPAEHRFNNLMDDFFPAFPSLFREEFSNNGFKLFAPANVIEVDNGFQLELVAPGFEKEDFKIELDKNIMTISVEKKEAKAEKFIRQEYKYNAFKRSFTLEENIDVEQIAAQYVNGVLRLNLPKKATVQAATKQITIQ